MLLRAYIGVFFLLAVTTDPSDAQFAGLFRAIQRVFNPITDTVRRFFGFRNTAASLRNSGRDELFPSDCGRDAQNKGKLCFGDPALCRASEFILIFDDGLNFSYYSNPKFIT